MITAKSTSFHPRKKGPGRRNWRTESEAKDILADMRNLKRLPFFAFPGAKLARRAAEKTVGKAVLK